MDHHDPSIPVLRLDAEGKIHDHDGGIPDGENSLAMSIETRGDDDSLQVRIILTAPDGIAAPKMTAVFTMDAPDFDGEDHGDADTTKAALYAKAQIAALSAVLPEVLDTAFKDATTQAVKGLERRQVRSEVITEVIASLAMMKADGDKDRAKAFVLDTLDEWSTEADGPKPSPATRDAMCAKVYDVIDTL